MNFQKIPPVEKFQSYIDSAFKAMNAKGEKIKRVRLSGDNLKKSRHIAKEKIKAFTESMTGRLKKTLLSFPNIDDLPEFYQELIRATIDYRALKHSFGALNWAVKQENIMSRNYLNKIDQSREIKRVHALLREYCGRACSVLKQVKNELRFLEEVRKLMRNYPDVKDMKTVVIIGFPNVGKTTLLMKLSGSKAEINSYPFTTKSINVGYYGKGDDKVQLLDVPGALNRAERTNPIEKLADIAVKHLADVLVYVFDLTGSYPVNDQIKLYKKVKRSGKDVIVYFSKEDIIGEEKIREFSVKGVHDEKELMKMISA